MRLLLLGTATIALSGCSWLGLGGSNHYYGPSAGYGHQTSANLSTVAPQALSRWNLEGAVGTEFIVGGDAVTGDQAHPGVTANTVKMKDAYDSGMRYELGGSYALSPNRKVTLMGSYASAEGKQINVGTTAPDGAGAAVTGTLDDYERWGIEAGLRQYFMPQQAPIVRALRPYVEGKIGAAKIEDIALRNTTGGGPATVNMYEGGWVPTAAGMVGVEAPIFKRATLGLETGIRYTGALKSDNTVLSAGVPFAGINNGSSSWTVPVMLRGRYRF